MKIDNWASEDFHFMRDIFFDENSCECVPSFSESSETFTPDSTSIENSYRKRKNLLALTPSAKKRVSASLEAIKKLPGEVVHDKKKVADAFLYSTRVVHNYAIRVLHISRDVFYEYKRWFYYHVFSLVKFTKQPREELLLKLVSKCFGVYYLYRKGVIFSEARKAIPVTSTEHNRYIKNISKYGAFFEQCKEILNLEKVRCYFLISFTEGSLALKDYDDSVFSMFSTIVFLLARIHLGILSCNFIQTEEFMSKEKDLNNSPVYPFCVKCGSEPVKKKYLRCYTKNKRRLYFQYTEDQKGLCKNDMIEYFYFNGAVSLREAIKHISTCRKDFLIFKKEAYQSLFRKIRVITQPSDKIFFKLLSARFIIYYLLLKGNNTKQICTISGIPRTTISQYKWDSKRFLRYASSCRSMIDLETLRSHYIKPFQSDVSIAKQFGVNFTVFTTFRDALFTLARIHKGLEVSVDINTEGVIQDI